MKVNEPYHWKEAISTVLCFIFGFVLIGLSGDYGAMAVIGGILLIALSIASFVFTEGWQYSIDLSIEKKIAAYIPVIVGGVFVFVAFFVINLFFASFMEGVRSQRE